MKEENNFVLIIVGVVAIVAIVGILNFSGMTGKGIIQTSSEKEIYTTEWECKGCSSSDGKTGCKYNCISDLVETTESGVSSYKLWQCGDNKDKICHKLYYRIS